MPSHGSRAAGAYPAAARPGAPLTVGEILAVTGAQLGAQLAPQAVRERRIRNIAALRDAGAADICFLDDAAQAGELAASRAGACLLLPRLAPAAPPDIAALLTDEPYRAFVKVAQALFADALRPSSLFESSGRAAGAQIDAAARLEAGVTIDPLAAIGPRAEIGAGTVIGAGAAIGPDVRIGRHCAIGPGATILHALIGDRVIVHPGARIGQAGFDCPAGAGGRLRLPQTRRVIVQDDVEIGANSTVDCGSIRDTVVGEGSRIGNLVHIAHDVGIGRHCRIGAQAGIASGVTAADFVIIGERAGIAGRLTLGERAIIAGQCSVNSDVPARAAGKSDEDGA
jgi:UDP-3-O-[3-hydroxymyristoyl] glucosamine N-acyltransferase